MVFIIYIKIRNDINFRQRGETTISNRITERYCQRIDDLRTFFRDEVVEWKYRLSSDDML